MKLAIEIFFLNWIALLAGAVSIAFYWLFVIVFNTHTISIVFQHEIDNVYFKLFSNGQFWIALIFLPMIALLPDATIKYFRMLYNPTDSDEALYCYKEYAGYEETESELMDDDYKSNKSSTKKPDTISRNRILDDAAKDIDILDNNNSEIGLMSKKYDSVLPMIVRRQEKTPEVDDFRDLEDDD